MAARRLGRACSAVSINVGDVQNDRGAETIRFLTTPGIVARSFMRRNPTYILLVLAFLLGTVVWLSAQEANEREIVSKTLPTLTLVRIPAQRKTFTMGSPRSGYGVIYIETEHEVTLSADYHLGVTTVTWGQFAAFVKDDGYQTDPEKGPGGTAWVDDQKDWIRDKKFSWRNTGYEQTDEHPVANVSWNDAVAFCKWLSKKDGKEYRLPTEAEWEFACRAGTKTQFSFGDDQEEIAKYANVADATFREVTGMKWGITKSDGFAFAAPVGTYRANAFGIQDMHGNVMQLCSDVYADYPKEDSPILKGRPPRMTRSGCSAAVAGALRIIGSSDEPN
jgi:formylglycine-generating enzyme required for sulfatase activity